MIIRRLRLHPFAGTANLDQEFQPGLNVIVGPNEAGKTTLRNALWHVLFVSTKLNKRDTEKHLQPFLPLGGGDTVCVTAELGVGGENWELEKKWSLGGGQSHITRPDGGVISGVEAVDTTLEDLLTLREGTWRHALFASQGKTDSALENIVAGSPLDDLNEVLRRAGFETDGVSIEALSGAIQDRWESTFGRWDRERNRPEGNRGLERPWKKNVGSILQAWYEMEEARQALEQAEAYYHDLDAVLQELNEVSTGRESLEAWVTAHARAATDAGERRSLEADLSRVQTQEERLRKVSRDWPVAVSKADDLEARAQELEKRAGELAEEQRKAQAWEKAGQKRGMLTQVEGIQSKIAEARETLDAAVEVSEEQIEALEALAGERDRIRARLETAELGVVLSVKEAMDIEYRSGVEPAEKRSLSSEDKLEFTAGGRALIRHADWEVEVRSGDIDVAAEETRHREVEQKIAELLTAMGAEDLQGAKNLRTRHLEKSNLLSGLERQLSELLGDQSLEHLQAEVQATGGEEAPTRSAAEVAAEGATARAEAESARRSATERRQEIQGWVNEFQSPDHLLDQLVELRAERTELERKVEALLPLPEGSENAGQFLDEYETKRASLEEMKKRHNELLIEKATVEGRAPELEPAEATELHDHAEAAFQRSLRQGDAIDRIQREFDALRAEMDEDTLEPWLEHFGEVVAPISGQRYGAIDLDASTFSHTDTGLNVPFQVLSMGTRASLGLAVRLSMARWFLKDLKGFLVLDDPLVDLDPQRQEEAAAMLKGFAEDKQVILMTCHPRHAEILGGATVEM